MSRSIRSPQRRPGDPRRPRPIVLLGIDGAGKTTTATALADLVRACGHGAVVVSNRSGRRRLLRASNRLGRQIPAQWVDRVETVLRTVNVLTAHTRDRILARARDEESLQNLRTARAAYLHAAHPTVGPLVVQVGHLYDEGIY